MRILDRYIAILFMKNLGVGVIAFAGFFFFQSFMADFIDAKYTLDQLLTYHLLSIPHILAQMTPPAVLLATVMTLSGLSRANELTACFSIGVGLKRISLIIFSLVILICCVLLVAQDRILPPTYRKRTSYYWREMLKRPDFHLDLKQDKIWYRSGNVIYNLQRFDANQKTIYGMSVYQFDDDFRLTQLVDAEKAVYTDHGWRFMNGMVTVYPSEDPFPLTQQFKEKEMKIIESPKDFQEIDKEVKGLRLRELYSYVQRIRKAGADTKTQEVDFHSRISLSFIPLIMCALGIPFSIRGRREGSVARDLGLCLSVTFFYWLFYSVGLSLGTNGALLPWLAAWLPSLIFVAVAVTLIARLKQ